MKLNDISVTSERRGNDIVLDFHINATVGSALAERNSKWILIVICRSVGGSEESRGILRIPPTSDIPNLDEQWLTNFASPLFPRADLEIVNASSYYFTGFLVPMVQFQLQPSRSRTCSLSSL